MGLSSKEIDVLVNKALIILFATHEWSDCNFAFSKGKLDLGIPKAYSKLKQNTLREVVDKKIKEVITSAVASSKGDIKPLCFCGNCDAVTDLRAVLNSVIRSTLNTTSMEVGMDGNLNNDTQVDSIALEVIATLINLKIIGDE